MLLPPLVAIRESPEFHDIVNLDKSGWPECLLWHSWLPALSGSDLGDPWAVEVMDVAANQLEVALGSHVGEGQEPGGEFSLAGSEVPLADAPDVWSDGSLVLDKVSGVGVAGCGVYASRLWCCLGLACGEHTLTCFLQCLMAVGILEGCIAQYPALCRLCSVLSFGCPARWG